MAKPPPTTNRSSCTIGIISLVRAPNSSVFIRKQVRSSSPATEGTGAAQSFACTRSTSKMAEISVTSYFMHEQEEAAAKAIMLGAAETEGFLIGEIEESDLPRLE